MDALGVLNLQGFGLRSYAHPALGAAGALVHYATENLCAKPENLRTLQEYRSARTLLLDPATLRNLEIFASYARHPRRPRRSARDRPHHHRRRARDCSSDGSRRRRSTSLEIQRRQAAVSANSSPSPPTSPPSASCLGHIRDIPRILGRLQNRLRNPRELGGIRDTLAQIPRSSHCLDLLDARLVGHRLAAWSQHIRSPAPRPPRRSAQLARLGTRRRPPRRPRRTGNYIRAGYDPELDRLRVSHHRQQVLAGRASSAPSRKRTGIQQPQGPLHDSVFGYYIEVTKANLAPRPSRLRASVRPPPAASASYTEALKLKEKEIFSRRGNVPRPRAARSSPPSSAADPRRKPSLARPRPPRPSPSSTSSPAGPSSPASGTTASPVLDEGDHPRHHRRPAPRRRADAEDRSADVAVARGSSTAFVPNDTLSRVRRCPDPALLTGPNMAGKSTYIRQVALITLMAQVGCSDARQNLPHWPSRSHLLPRRRQRRPRPRATRRSWSR